MTGTILFSYGKNQNNEFKRLENYMKLKQEDELRQAKRDSELLSKMELEAERLHEEEFESPLDIVAATLKKYHI